MSSAACSSSPSTYDRALYWETLFLLSDKSATRPPVLSTKDGKKLVVALVHSGILQGTNLVQKAAMKNRKMEKCKVCQERLYKFLPLSILHSDGKQLVPLFMDPKTTPDAYKHLALINKEISEKTPIIGLQILYGDSFLFNLQEESGADPRGGLFHHFHISLPFYSDVGKGERNHLEKAFHRYCPQLLPSLLDTLMPRYGTGSPSTKIKNLVESLQIIQECIPKVTYGEKIQPSVDWLVQIAQRFEQLNKIPSQLSSAQLWLLSAEILLWTSLSPDGLDCQNTVSPVIQQAHNNVLPVMSYARNKTALINLLNHRLSPDQYQRRTAAPSEGQINNAIRGLGDFTNAVMTITEARDISHSIVTGMDPIPSEPVSSMTAFASMMKFVKASRIDSSEPTTQKRDPSSLAGRCGNELDIKGIHDLLAYVRANPTKKIYLDTTTTTKMESVYIAKTTLSNDKLCVPYLWAFLRDSTTKKLSFSPAMAEVALILPQFEDPGCPHRNIIFLLKNCTQKPVDVGNCCFPEFLSVACRRVCGSAFEEMNKQIRLPLPDKDSAIGRGTSVINATGQLMYEVRVQVEGKVFTLTNL